MGKLHEIPGEYFDYLLRSADDLIAANDPEWRTEIQDDGTSYTYPIYEDIDVERIKVRRKSEPLIATREHGFRTETKVGRQLAATAIMSNGAHRGMIINEVDDKYRQGAAFTVGQGAAYLTATRGVLSSWNDAVARSEGKDTIKLGPAASGKNNLLTHYLLAPFTIYPTIRTAVTHTLSRSAQEKQAIFRAATDRFELAPDLYRRSISMDGMEAIGEEAYARQHGINIVHNHIIVPCGLSDMGIEDMGKLARGTVSELRSIVRILAAAIKDRDSERFRGTVTLNPHVAAATIIGNTPAVANDEPRRIWESMSPRDTYRTVDVRSDDGLSMVPEPELLMKGQNTYFNLLPGSHCDSVREEANAQDIYTLREFDRRFSRADGNLTQDDMEQISRHPDALRTSDREPFVA